MLLPYLEATPVYNAINFSFDPLVCNSQNFQNTAFLTTIPALLCPTDPYSGARRTDQQLLRQYRHDDRRPPELRSGYRRGSSPTSKTTG